MSSSTLKVNFDIPHTFKKLQMCSNSSSGGGGGGGGGGVGGGTIKSDSSDTTTATAMMMLTGSSSNNNNLNAHNGFELTSGGCSGLISPPLSANLESFGVPHFGMKPTVGAATGAGAGMLGVYGAFGCGDFTQPDLQFSDFALSYCVETTPGAVYAGQPLQQEANYGLAVGSAAATPTSCDGQAQREDVVFRFEPEDIARLSSEGNNNNNNYFHGTCHTNCSTPAYTPNISGSCAVAAAAAACHSLDVEYFNYDEINCQSKEQSPCSTPPLDPWLALGLGELSPQQSGVDACAAPTQSPKRDNTSGPDAYYGATSRLPSMTSAFGAPKCEPVACYGYVEDATATASTPPSPSSPTLMQQQQQQQDCFYAGDRCGDSHNSMYEPLTENYEQCNLSAASKPNREHKFIWTIEELDEYHDELMAEWCFSQPERAEQSALQQQQASLQEDVMLDYNNILALTASGNNCDSASLAVESMLHGASRSEVGAEGTGADDDDDSVFLPPATVAVHHTHQRQQQQHQQQQQPKAKRRQRYASQATPCHSTPNTTGTLAAPAATALINSGDSQHQQEEADAAVPMICRWTDCNETFPNQGAFVAHIEKRHVDVRKGEDFSCFWLDCPRRYKPFNARYKLLIHMRVHSGEKPNKCPFPSCNKAFSRLENLKIHQRSHTGERPYGCQYKGCLKAFSNSSDRAKHQRTHYDTKPYACQLPGCTKRYTDPSSLRKHVKNHTLRNANGHLGRRRSTGGALAKQRAAATAAAVVATTKTRSYSESCVGQVSNSSSNKCNRPQQKQQQQRRAQRSNSCTEFLPAQNTNDTSNKSSVKMPIGSKLMCSGALGGGGGGSDATGKINGSSSNNGNSMNFNELSNCIVTIEHNQSEHSIDVDQQQHQRRRQQLHQINDDDDEDDDNDDAMLARRHQQQLKLQRRHSCSSNKSNSSNSSSDASSCSSSNENINQLNEHERLHLPTAAAAAADDNVTCNVNYSSSNNNNNNNNHCHAKFNINSSTNSNSSSNDNYNQSNCNAHTYMPYNYTTTTTTAIDANETVAAATTTTTPTTSPHMNEFVSFEYVKKLLSETFDYDAQEAMQLDADAIADDDADNADNDVVTKVMMCKQASVGSGSTSTATATTMATANAHCDYANNYEMEYLKGFL